MTAVDDADREASRADRPRLWPGLLGGALAGALIWVAYFVQASTTDWASWKVLVMPALAVTAIGALVIGLVTPAVRRTTVGVALGAVLTLPLVLGAFAMVFLLLNLD